MSSGNYLGGDEKGMICYQSRIVESTLHRDTAHVMNSGNIVKKIFLKGFYMITKEKIDSAMKDLSAGAKEIYGDKLKEVILFGSCARGEFSNDSDIDVMILLDVSKESLRTERDRLDQVIWNLDAKYDYDLLFAPIVKSDSEFNQWIDVIPFYKSVRREGVRYA